MPNLSDSSLTALHRSWQRFKLGLGLFIVGATLLMTLSDLHIAVYAVALGILLIGFVIAMSGYLAILWLRLKAINPVGKRSRRDPFR